MARVEPLVNPSFSRVSSAGRPDNGSLSTREKFLHGLSSPRPRLSRSLRPADVIIPGPSPIFSVNLPRNLPSLALSSRATRAQRQRALLSREVEGRRKKKKERNDVDDDDDDDNDNERMTRTTQRRRENDERTRRTRRTRRTT